MFASRNKQPPRRAILAGIGAFGLCGGVFGRAQAAPAGIVFEELYGAVGVLGMSFSEKATALAGRQVRMRGFMAPPLKAEATFFVLTKIPLALCPFCSSDADWPSDIVVVYLGARQTFVQANAPIDVDGTLELGSWTDPETGFVSLLRLRDSRFKVA